MYKPSRFHASMASNKLILNTFVQHNVVLKYCSAPVISILQHFDLNWKKFNLAFILFFHGGTGFPVTRFIEMN